ncbi:MAG: YraN family protein [Planctomycetota bacterium]
MGDPLGDHGENLAAEHLQQSGVEILERNWRCSLGEIDLVGRHGDCLVFVEVKTRRHMEAGHPLEAITARKMRQVIRCAKAWLQDHPSTELQPRFDAVGIILGQGPPQIEWVQGAFGEDGC